jgi:hypothetical protein
MFSKKNGVELWAFDGIILRKARPIMRVQYCVSSDSKLLYEIYNTCPVSLWYLSENGLGGAGHE